MTVFSAKHNATKVSAVKKISLAISSGVIATTLLIANAASASTIDFSSGAGTNPYVEDGFSFTPNRIVNGNCEPAGPCLGLNNNQTAVMTFAGGLFTLQSIHFSLLGNGSSNTLTVFETGNASNAISFSASAYTHNTYYTELFADTFFGVTSITFASSSGGNVRIDNVEASAVPLPATGWLLSSGLMGMVSLARRRVG
ncbi:MAG: hypothetical protein QM709_07470 [Spongiibacteraceae bacterium]